MQISSFDMGNLPHTCKFLSEFSGNKWVGQKIVLPGVKKTVERVFDGSFVNCENVNLVRYSLAMGGERVRVAKY